MEMVRQKIKNKKPFVVVIIHIKTRVNPQNNNKCKKNFWPVFSITWKREKPKINQNKFKNEGATLDIHNINLA